MGHCSFVVDGRTIVLVHCRRAGCTKEQHRLAGRKGLVVLHIYSTHVSIVLGRGELEKALQARNCDGGVEAEDRRLTRTAT